MEKKLAKPTGITLLDHTSNVMGEFIKYLETQHFFVKKINIFFKDVDIIKIIIKAISIHDFGKIDDPWQRACVSDYKLMLEGKNGTNIMNANYRHEFGSVYRFNNEISDETFIGVSSHHSKLRLIQKNIDHILRVEGVEDMKDSKIFARIRQIDWKLKKMNEVDRARETYKYNAVRSILQHCDRKASYFESNGNEYEEKLKFKGFKYEFPFKNKRAIQELTENNWDYDLLLIKARTGGGKTSASQLWGKRIIESGLADRMIIAMPTIFTTNAIGKSINESGCECYSYNSSTKNLVKDIDNSDEKSYFYFDLYQRRTFSYPLVACTIDTLLNSIVQKSEDAHSANFNIGNSCVVIDEFDFYDDLVMSNIKILLRHLYALKVRVLLMSATFPISYRDFFLDISPEYNVSPLIIDDTYDHQDKYHINNILEYNFNDIRTIGDEIIKKVLNHDKTIIFCNTQNSTINMYNYFGEIIGYDKVIVYNSNHKPEHKQIKEEEILNDFGKVPKTNKYRVLIMSQIGELSLDITSDYMISEICPIDRLIQRFGRLGRFDDLENPIIREIDILIPYKNNNFFPAPYGVLDNKGRWIVSDKLDSTKEFLKKGTYSNKKLQDINNKVYENGVELESDVPNNVALYESLIKSNSIILPDKIVSPEEMDDANVTQWQRRRFLIKRDIFIEFPNVDKISKLDFNILSTRNVVDVYQYQLSQLIDSNYVGERKVLIEDNWGEREINIFVLLDQKIYSYERGLDLSIFG